MEQSLCLLIVSTSATAVFDTGDVGSIHPLTLHGAVLFPMKKANYYCGKNDQLSFYQAYWFNLFALLYTPSFRTVAVLIITLSFPSPINTLGGIFHGVQICIDPARLLGAQHEVSCAYSSLGKLGILNRQDCLSDGKDVKKEKKSFSSM